MNCTTESDDAVNVFQFVVYIPIYIIGLIVNALSLWVFCWKLRKWTETTIYMINLAVSDVVLLSSLPFKIYSHKEWTRHKIPLCIFTESLYFVNMYVSIFIITCINVDRYITIRHPFLAKSLRSPKKAAVVCAAIWIIMCLWSVLIYHKYSQITKDEIVCFKQISFENDVPVTASLYIVGFVIPLMIVTFCSVQIVHALRQSNMTNSAEFTTVKTMRIIVGSAIIFAVCFTPVHVGYFLQWLPTFNEDCVSRQHVNLFLQVATCISNMNCCLNGFGYYFASAEVCDVFKIQFKSQKPAIAISNVATIELE
ncbi:G-protein coupled receptor 35-like [Scyliorhinus canicula]|uniref:G-protein coupled receptor 35-like n=1 Tax=Scyliorhinus canicula TaxID=7830 RepID=UPI0018F77745|nr:G-protein coupled receptor 35-like [Scyliorhinus canicula]XP_038673502.1 G-protein coupled receptor 35-like [Scyliorhinus canicula]XP_038673503.1 G-protein coupled receptor 35-like [Scyliorhinus canicula]XP_038673505.1 G-protein coupled receptor 35-like [Scyliorhinus canicula]